MKCSFLLFLLFASVLSLAQANRTIPHLIKQGNRAQLVVEGKPFLVRGGELGNSSSSSMQYMKPIWPKLKAMHLNTVLAPVYWELIEPEEGKFDFKLVDDLIKEARANDIKLVFLWFASWKNSMSTYAPGWLKKDVKRFQRAQDKTGKAIEILSAFSSENVKVDAKAFKALMQHVKAFDEKEQTVIMIQVENEIGMLTEAREYTAEANKAFNQPVPQELINYLQKNKDVIVPELKEKWTANGSKTKGTWEELFGKGLATDEIFQAWTYAKYTEAVTRAGKEAYNIPMFVNAALPRTGRKPGEYPSAGPLPHIMDIWQAAAPSLDMLSPDFYNPDFKYWNDLYVRRGNALFIPEIRFEPSDGVKALYAIGHYGAVGFSPFSIESTAKPEEENIGKAYKILSQLQPYIIGNNMKMEGVLMDKKVLTNDLQFGDYVFTVSHDLTLGWSPKAKDEEWPMSGGIIIQTATDEFWVAGSGIVITFSDKRSVKKSIGILEAEEGSFENGKWVPVRRLNGDQTHQGRHIRIPVDEWGIQKVKLYEYE